MPRLTFRWTGSLLAAAATVAAGGCGGPQETPEVGASALGVTVAAVRLDSLRDVASGPGTVVPALAADWTITAPEPGEIAELTKAVGDAVAPGDLLVRFEIASRTQARAAAELEVLASERRLEAATAELTRQTDLYDRGIVSRSAFETTRNERAAAESALNQARTQLQALDADQASSVVRARFAGTVMEVWHAPGDTVAGGPGDPVLRVVDPSRIQVSLQVPVAQYARVLTGQQATIRSFTADAGEPATVASAPQLTDPSAATGEVRLSFVNPVTLPLGTPVSASILLDVRSSVLVVPTDAVQHDELGAYVMVAGSDDVAHRRDVTTGLVAGELTQIVSGLEAGDMAITSGITAESDGLPITVIR